VKLGKWGGVVKIVGRLQLKKERGMRMFFRESALRIFLGLFLSGMILSGCAEPTDIELPISITRQPASTPTETVVAPTELPPPPKTLVVCLGAEPESLFLYGNTQPEADTILQALCDGPVDVRDFGYEPVILTKLPALEDGDANIEQVVVSEGDVYLNPETQLPDTLEAQKPYLPSGCHQMECVKTYSEGDVVMDRLVAEFQLISGITWSDGEPLKASDSVYSFQLDADEATPTTKYLVQRTSRYVSLDELRTQWAGIPGFLDPEFESNFWSPLPEHILGSYTVDELFSLEEASKTPLGWGPYVIESWEAGEQITMRRSETYFRSGEGLPAFELLRFRFLGNDYVSALEQVLTGECDILDESILPSTQWQSAQELQESGRLQLASTAGTVIERLDFNITKNSSVDSISLFSDVRMRQAIAGCIDRQALVEEVAFGLSVVPDSYLPPSHPLHIAEAPAEPLSSSEAIDLLTEMGWQDHDDDPSTPRVAQGVAGIMNDATLEFHMLTTGDPLHESLAEKIKADLAQCGINAIIEYGDAKEVFTPWPNGPVFGGRFDTVLWAWPVFVSPPCELYGSFEIPFADFPFGLNASGFADQEYDQACRRIIFGPPTGEDYIDAIRETERIYQTQRPSIPLYIRPRMVAFGEEICGIKVDPTSFSTLWNMEEISAGEDCSP
jgi:peptide/nickel transport system substrate-binding protein